MNANQADQLSEEILQALNDQQVEVACAVLQPVLTQWTPFRLIDRIALDFASAASPDQLYPYLERIAADRTEGGWVVIASALWTHYRLDPTRVIQTSREYITTGDVWYAADIIAERVPGPALVSDFERSLSLVKSWRSDPSRWVRRSLGVAAHFWAKRSRGRRELAGQAKSLLNFLQPMFSEWEMDATKGVAWGLKTIGRYYPDLVAYWLLSAVLPGRPRYRAHMLRKVCLYLSQEQREEIELFQSIARN